MVRCRSDLRSTAATTAATPTVYTPETISGPHNLALGGPLSVRRQRRRFCKYAATIFVPLRHQNAISGPRNLVFDGPLPSRPAAFHTPCFKVLQTCCGSSSSSNRSNSSNSSKQPQLMPQLTIAGAQNLILDGPLYSASHLEGLSKQRQQFLAIAQGTTVQNKISGPENRVFSAHCLQTSLSGHSCSRNCSSNHR